MRGPANPPIVAVSRRTVNAKATGLAIHRAHGIGEIVTAASAAGLGTEALTEYLPTAYGLRAKKIL